MMRVARWYHNRDVRVEEMPVPEIHPGELLVRVEASGICGSDVMEWYRLDRAPLVLGHEVAGEIVELGEGVEGFALGERVVLAHHVPCNTCHYCLRGHHSSCDTLRRTNFDPGGFAEYLRVPAINVDRGVFPLPEELSYEDATFVEPLACVLRGHRRAGMQPGDGVLVMGSGIAGLLHIQVARSMGAGRIVATDASEYRVAAAGRFGADVAFLPADFSTERLREVNQGRLADVVLVCTGALAAVEQSLRMVDRGGTVLFFAPTGPGVAVPISINELFWRTDITLTTSYAGSPADYRAALEIIRGGGLPLHQMITHRLSLEETGLGFRLVAAAAESLKVIVEPQR